MFWQSLLLLKPDPEAAAVPPTHPAPHSASGPGRASLQQPKDTGRRSFPAGPRSPGLTDPVFSLFQRERLREGLEWLTHPRMFSTWSEDGLTHPAKWVTLLTAVPISQKLLRLEASLRRLDGTLLAGELRVMSTHSTDGLETLVRQTLAGAGGGVQHAAGGGVGGVAMTLWGCCISGGSLTLTSEPLSNIPNNPRCPLAFPRVSKAAVSGGEGGEFRGQSFLLATTISSWGGGVPRK